MKTLKWALAATALTSLLALGLPAQAQTAHEHEHEHGGTTQQQLQLNQGQKWSTDAPLRRGMEAIRGIVAPQLEAAHAGKLEPDQYRRLAGQVETEVAGIVRNCQLEPAADAQLHLLIADIGAGVDAMNGKTPDTSPVEGLLKLTQAVNQYRTYFEHPGFAAIPVAH